MRDEASGDGEALLALARAGDEGAFRALAEAHQAELHAHCYRMLASYHDAEDALQETLLRAWRALPGFEGRSTLRAWLYKIATNASLDVAKHRNRRELPVSYGPPVPAGSGPGADNGYRHRRTGRLDRRPRRLGRIGEAYQDKYRWPVTVVGSAFDAPYAAPTAGDPPYRVYELTPALAYAFGTDNNLGERSTRFRFSA